MKVAPVSNICYLVFHAHLCPVGPRVLDSCSLNIRAIHIREAYEPPWARAWFILISWGHKLVWGFIYYPVLMPCYCFIYDCARSTLYCLGFVTRFRGIDTPSFRVPSHLQPAPQTSGPSRSRPVSLRVYSKGWPPEIFLNPVITLSWKPRWVLIWFFRGWSCVCCYLCTPAG